MEDPITMVAFAGSYSDRSAAEADFEAIKELHRDKLINKYQAAIFEKQDDGKVKIINTTSTTRTTGAKWGVAVGAVAGLMFPPLLLADLAGGAAVGALAGNVLKGWGAEDIKKIGADLDTGELGVLLIAQATPDLGADKALARARRADKSDLSHAQAEVEPALDAEA
jgi:uncharacterized membrane protein